MDLSPGNILFLLTSVISLASAVCAFTKTPADDLIVKKYGARVGTLLVAAYKFLEILALNFGNAKTPAQAEPVTVPSHIRERAPRK